MVKTQFDVISEARNIFDKEITALYKTRDSIGVDFEKNSRSYSKL